MLINVGSGYHFMDRRKMVYENYVYRGHALSIAIGTLLVLLVFMGGAGALSEAAMSENVQDIYPEITSSNGIFPDHRPGKPMNNPQRAEQFSDPAGAEKMYR